MSANTNQPTDPKNDQNDSKSKASDAANRPGRMANGGAQSGDSAGLRPSKGSTGGTSPSNAGGGYPTTPGRSASPQQGGSLNEKGNHVDESDEESNEKTGKGDMDSAGRSPKSKATASSTNKRAD